MRDPLGIVPPEVRLNYERGEMVDRQVRAAFALYEALQAIDSRFDLVFVSDRADPEYGVRPGRWHVVRKNDAPAPDSYMAITTPSGGYREPDSGVLDEIRRRDLWKTGIEPYLGPTKNPKPEVSREQMLDEAIADTRAAYRVPGDAGLEKRLWGKR